MNNISEMELYELRFELQRIDEEFDQLYELLDFDDAHLSEELSEEHQSYDIALAEYDYWH